MLFWSLWKIVQPFVDPVTRQKVVFVYKKEAEQEFAQVFDPEVSNGMTYAAGNMPPMVALRM